MDKTKIIGFLIVAGLAGLGALAITSAPGFSVRQSPPPPEPQPSDAALAKTIRQWGFECGYVSNAKRLPGRTVVNCGGDREYLVEHSTAVRVSRW